MTLNIQGGVCQFEDEVSQGRGGYFGWMGFGGYIHKFHRINFSGSYSFCITDFNFLLSVIRSVFQWHPELKIGFGCVSKYRSIRKCHHCQICSNSSYLD